MNEIETKKIEDMEFEELKKREHEEAEKFMNRFIDALIVALSLSFLLLVLVVIFQVGS